MTEFQSEECTPEQQQRRIIRQEYFEDLNVKSLNVSNEFDKYLDDDCVIDSDSITRQRKTANNFFKVSDEKDGKIRDI